jgi:hypothetical protein
VIGLGPTLFQRRVLVPNENGFYLPETIAETTLLGGTLDHLWLLQGAASPLADEATAGPVTISETGAGVPALAYQQALGGWTRLFIEFFDTGGSGAKYIGNSGLVNINTTSFVALLLWQATTAPASNIMQQFGNAGALTTTLQSGTGLLQLNVNGTVVSGAHDYRDGSTHMSAFAWDVRGAGQAYVQTEIETVTNAWDAGATDLATKRICGGFMTPPDMYAGWAGLAVGGNAEALIDAAGGPIGVYTV